MNKYYKYKNKYYNFKKMIGSIFILDNYNYIEQYIEE